MKNTVLIFNISILTVLLSFNSVAQSPQPQPQSQPAEPNIAISLRPSSSPVFLHETFRIILTITSTGIQLGQEFSLLSMPDENKLKILSQFKELPPKQQMTSNNIVEIRTFTADARAMVPELIQMAPNLRMGIISRESTPIGTRMVQIMQDIPVQPVNISVQPLPETGRPEDFSGAVGQFSFNATIEPLNTAVGDLLTAVTTITGIGYLENLSPPRISPGRFFRVYEPEPLPNDNDKQRKFKQIIVPQSTNATEISKVSFSYFDTRIKSYRTISQGPFRITFHEKTVSAKTTPFRPQQSETNTATQPAVKQENGFEKTLQAFFTKNPKAVLLKNESARIAPARSALPTFDLPKDTVVEVIESYQNWAKISLKDKRGWIPKDSVAPQR